MGDRVFVWFSMSAIAWIAGSLDGDVARGVLWTIAIAGLRRHGPHANQHREWDASPDSPCPRVLVPAGIAVGAGIELVIAQPLPGLRLLPPAVSAVAPAIVLTGVTVIDTNRGRGHPDELP